MPPLRPKNQNAMNADSGQETFLHLMNEQLMGWDDPRAMLEDALKRDGFQLLAQKILPVRTGLQETACYEILLRLKHEEDNLLPPGGFFDVAESLGMMGDIDRWVVRKVISWGCARAKKDPSIPEPMMCVNLSADSLKDDTFAQFVHDELSQSGYPPRALCFELSEPDVIEHHAAREFLAAIKPGCRVTLDGFGGIRVSFTHLRDLAVDFIKIDGTITQGIMRDPYSLAKVRAINAACQKIGARSIAEFVETRQMFEKLREIGVDYVQGFGVARPAPISELP